MNNTKKIGIIGYGYVGKSVYQLFKDHFEMRIYDPCIDGYDTDEHKKQINEECDLAIICVPTPEKNDGSVDTSIVETSVDWLETPLILIRSTVPPGTCDKLSVKYFIDGYQTKRIVFSPENVGEGKYEVPYWKGYPHPTDSKKHEFVIAGGHIKKDVDEVLEYFKIVMGPFAKYYSTDFKTAEMTKYVINSYIATIVTFCNEIYEIAEKLKINYGELRELFLLDKRISRSHTLVFKNKRGYSGKCIPKDTKGLHAVAIKNKYNPEFIEQIIKSNKKFNEKNINNG